ncbi:MAG: tRNA (N6-threonylcarbamoyladenosine(37)-N6)-methyltransferase TrmO [Clostridia bacterium]|nr:tRNA (N6-threonylcarbamoyladenosine(37)-N6)-methyltransferase TrmO [Clostridia bacterium]
MQMKIIARIYTGFPEKFGVPRQSGIAENRGKIIFEPEYRIKEAVRGLDGYEYIWLIWMFDKAVREKWSPTVRPPRLGGNTRMGVFATRSPFRPNPIGLSAVRLDRVEMTAEYGPVLHVTGADLIDGTPIFDIKPYLPFADSKPDAAAGFSDAVRDYSLSVEFPENAEKTVEPEILSSLKSVLSHDPRPAYHDNADRLYGMEYCGYSVKFTVDENMVSVTQIIRIKA